MAAGAWLLPALPDGVWVGVGEAPPPLALPLIFFDPTGSAGVPLLRRAAEEAQRLLEGAGLPSRSRLAATSEVVGARAVKVVVLPRPQRGRALSANVMGEVACAPAVTSIWVFLEAVGRALGHEPGGRARWSARVEHELGVAMGRVVAHELVHLLAPERPHAAGGLLAGSVSRSDLLRSTLTLPEDLRAQLRAATVALLEGPRASNTPPAATSQD
jgi:hypothetical protein